MHLSFLSLQSSDANMFVCEGICNVQRHTTSIHSPIFPHSRITALSTTIALRHNSIVDVVLQQRRLPQSCFKNLITCQWGGIKLFRLVLLKLRSEGKVCLKMGRMFVLYLPFKAYFDFLYLYISVLRIRLSPTRL